MASTSCSFVKEYNAKTADKVGTIIPVEITIFEDRTFEINLKTPPCSELLKKSAGIDKGAATPNKVRAGSVTMAKVTEIAKIKMPDLNCNTVESAEKMVMGTARNMGIKIEG